MSERLRVGVLGAAWIADRAMLPALREARNAEPVAIASRDPARATALARRHGVANVHAGYAALLEDRGIDAVYVALVNSAHAPWSIRALDAGKHVLCEKPLAVDAREAAAMAAASERSGRTLMEAYMYRFHPRMRELRTSFPAPDFAHAAFSFRLERAAGYRVDPGLGGGVLLDVGCYTLDVIHWFLGEPTQVRSFMRGAPVDMSVGAALTFEGGRSATAWASFEAAEHQQLTLVSGTRLERILQPFTAWRDPHDPYRIMVEEFARSIIDGTPPPRSLADSIATAALIDRVRDAARARPAPAG